MDKKWKRGMRALAFYDDGWHPARITYVSEKDHSCTVQWDDGTKSQGMLSVEIRELPSDADDGAKPGATAEVKGGGGGGGGGGAGKPAWKRPSPGDVHAPMNEDTQKRARKRKRIRKKVDGSTGGVGVQREGEAKSWESYDEKRDVAGYGNVFSHPHGETKHFANRFWRRTALQSHPLTKLRCCEFHHNPLSHGFYRVMSVTLRFYFF